MPKQIWQPGQSGNPNGRPPKNRALTTILERAGARTLTGRDGQSVSRKRLVADLAWQIITTGKAIFPDGSTLYLEAKDWFDTVKWIYSHIDGPAKQAVEVSTPPEQPFEVKHEIDIMQIGRDPEARRLIAELLGRYAVSKGDTGNIRDRV